MVPQHVPFSSAGRSPPLLQSNLLISVFPPISVPGLHTSSLSFTAFLPGSLAFFPLDSSDSDCSHGTKQIASLALSMLRCVDGDGKKRGADSEKTGNNSEVGPDCLPSTLAFPRGAPAHPTQERRQTEVTFGGQVLWANWSQIRIALHFLSICYFKSIFLIHSHRY